MADHISTADAADLSDARVIYLSSFEYSTSHAHPLHALFMARGFAELLGNRFLFIVGKEGRELSRIPHRVPFTKLRPLLRALHLRTVAYGGWLKTFLFIHLFARPRWTKNLTIFTNDLSLAAMMTLSKRSYGFRLVVEVHGKAHSFVTWLALHGASQIVFVTEGLKEELARTPKLAAKSVVLGNAVDAEKFAAAAEDAEARRATRAELNIPDDATVIGYIGRFHPMQSDKGVSFMIDALADLPEQVRVLLVGGTEEEIATEKERVNQLDTDGALSRVIFVPYVDAAQVPRYQAVCDILAYVPPQADAFLATETSPMKLYEYMASTRPIIASDLPAFREALGGEAYFIEPGARAAYAAAVESIRAHPDDANARAARAFARIQDRTWRARARTILTT